MASQVKKVKMHEIKNPASRSGLRMNPVSSVAESLKEMFELNNRGDTYEVEAHDISPEYGNLIVIAITYDKLEDRETYGQMVIYQNPGGAFDDVRFIVNGPEQGPFEDEDDAVSAVRQFMVSTLISAADQSEIRATVNPGPRVNPEEFYDIQYIEDFNTEMTRLYDAAVLLLGGKKDKKILDEILVQMKCQVDGLRRRFDDPDFVRSVWYYNNSDNAGLQPEIDLEGLDKLSEKISLVRMEDLGKLDLATFNEAILTG